MQEFDSVTSTEMSCIMTPLVLPDDIVEQITAPGYIPTTQFGSSSVNASGTLEFDKNLYDSTKPVFANYTIIPAAPPHIQEDHWNEQITNVFQFGIKV